MAFKSECVNMKNEVYSCLHTVPSGVMSPVQRNYTVNTYISAKARAFTIDALLNTDKIQKKPEKSRQVTRENRTADCQQSALNETKYRYANGVITPPKQQIYESSSDAQNQESTTRVWNNLHQVRSFSKIENKRSLEV